MPAPVPIDPGPIVTAEAVAITRLDGLLSSGRMGDSVVDLGDWDGDGLGAMAMTHRIGDVVAMALVMDGHLGTDVPYAAALLRDFGTLDALAVGNIGPGGSAVLLNIPTMLPASVLGIPLPVDQGVYFAWDHSAFALDKQNERLTGLSAADVNGDGWDDLVVSTSTWIESASVFLGPLEGPLVFADDRDLVFIAQTPGGSIDDSSSYGEAAVPDIDGDGVADVMIGIPRYDYWGRDPFWDATGAVFLYTQLQAESGVQSAGAERAAIVGTCDAKLDGQTRAVVGDVTGDGITDIAEDSYHLSPPDRAEAGGVFIYAMPCLATATGVVDITTVSSAVIVGTRPFDTHKEPEGLGDLNGDGIDDLAVGAAFSGSGHGAVYIFLGPIQGVIDAADADLVIEGSGEDGQFGAAVAGVTDMDGDGIPDLAVGAPSSSWAEYDSGSVYLFSGARLLEAM